MFSLCMLSKNQHHRIQAFTTGHIPHCAWPENFLISIRCHSARASAASLPHCRITARSFLTFACASGCSGSGGLFREHNQPCICTYMCMSSERHKARCRACAAGAESHRPRDDATTKSRGQTTILKWVEWWGVSAAAVSS